MLVFKKIWQANASKYTHKEKCQVELNNLEDSHYKIKDLTTVLPKAALLSCARFTCDIYANFSLLVISKEFCCCDAYCHLARVEVHRE